MCWLWVPTINHWVSCIRGVPFQILDNTLEALADAGRGVEGEEPVLRLPSLGMFGDRVLYAEVPSQGLCGCACMCACP